MRLFLVACVLLAPSLVHAADYGFFDCLSLTPDQAAWFQASGIASCCSLADGMPTRYEERDDGVYVPPFSQAVAEAKECRDHQGWQSERQNEPDHSHWVQVPGPKVLLKANPIGFAVVWWTNAKYFDQKTPHEIRCFVGTSKV